jgi:hypothetical protein
MTQVNVIDVIQPVAQLVKNCPVNTLVRAYVDAARTLCGESRWLRATVTGSTIADQRIYLLGNDPSYEIIGITAITITESADKVRTLTERASSRWDRTEANDLPEFYQYIPEAQFAVHPLANRVLPMQVGVVVQPKRGATALDDSLLTRWDRALENGALAYLLDMKTEAWYDPAKANKSLLFFNAAVFSANHVAENNFNAGAMPTDHIGPRSAAVRTGRQVL